MLQLSQRPLSASSADAALFVGREREIDKILRAVRLNLNCLVLGDKGVGKTTILHQVERRLREDDVAVRFVGAGTVEDTQGLTNRLAEVIHRRPKSSSPMAGLAAATGTEVDSDVRLLGDDVSGRLVVLVDGIPQPGIAYGLFGGHRDDLWGLPFTWVVTGDASERRRLLQPPADSFFDAVITIEDLSDDEAKHLLELRLGSRPSRGDPAARALKGSIPSLVAQAMENNPRRLLAMARSVVLDDGDAAAVTDRLAGQQAVAAGISRPAAMLFSELIDHGPVSASDEGLLDSLGWTRSRVVQVMQQLAARGLVVCSSESPEGPGRPRKMWRINPTTDPDQRGEGT